MVAAVFQQAIAILLLAQSGFGTPAVDDDKGYKYEEYIVEHEVSSGQAKNSVITMSVNSSKYMSLNMHCFLSYKC